MSIAELIRIVPPPTKPVHSGTAESWKAVQEKLGIRLPTDYYEYGVTYGSGTMCNGFLRLFGWASPHFESYVSAETEGIRAAGTTLTRKVAVYPDTPGLFPWGRDENGISLCWMTGGDPNKWPVVIQSREGDEYQFDMAMCQFLVGVFNNRTSCPVWHEPFTPTELSFRPAES